MPTSSEIKTFSKIRDYAWETNAEFQAGLRAIISSAPASEVGILTNRAKCFYFTKYFAPSPWVRFHWEGNG
jgi:hypothetical protein